MRINVYSQELTSDNDIVSKEGTGESGQPAVFYGVRLYLHSPEQLHHTPDDDDRSAITFWVPKSAERRLALSNTLHRMGEDVGRMVPR